MHYTRSAQGHGRTVCRGCLGAVELKEMWVAGTIRIASSITAGPVCWLLVHGDKRDAEGGGRCRGLIRTAIERYVPWQRGREEEK